MSTERGYRVASRLGLATVVVMFGLMVLGSIVRTTGSGLACPDWPLCHGRLIPPLQFNVLVEWTHRLLALVVSLQLAALAGWIVFHRELRGRLGGLMLLALGLLAAQILLGALTVWKLLDPGIVGGHLAVALMLFSTVLTLTLAAGAEREGDAPAGPRPAGLLPLAAVATIATFGQAVLGGMVSTHHAGLACPDWPTCHGEWIPPLVGGVALQFFHRLGGYLLVAVVLLTAFRARMAPDPGLRAGALLAGSLVIAQVGLGVCNVLLGTPVWLSAVHLATAITILAMLVTVTFRTAALPAAAPALAGTPALTGGTR